MVSSTQIQQSFLPKFKCVFQSHIETSAVLWGPRFAKDLLLASSEFDYLG